MAKGLPYTPGEDKQGIPDLGSHHLAMANERKDQNLQSLVGN